MCAARRGVLGVECVVGDCLDIPLHTSAQSASISLMVSGELDSARFRSPRALARQDQWTTAGVKKFLQNRGIRVAQRDLGGKHHCVLRGADGCIGAQTWSFMDLAA